VNMLALMQNVIGPMYEQKYPDVQVSTIHTGPGDAGSRTIFEKLKAARDANRACWDVDVAVVHQVFMSWAIPEGLLLKYADGASTWKYVTSEHAKVALGTNIEGYGIPLFHSQVAIAYNTKYVKTPPKSYEEIVKWVQQNPSKFGYNGIKGGMSGVGFVIGWVYWKTGEYNRLTRGPHDSELIKTKVASAFQELKEFNKFVTITAGNVGTLDMLAREEIWMGPVWVDMFYTWMLEGRMPSHIRLFIPEPGLPGQPMYLVIPSKACSPDRAKQLIEYITSPEIQAKVIVERYNWYPGIDGKHVMDHVSAEAKQRLFGDITPEILSKYGRMFPLSQTFTEILKTYEGVVG
ncbi:MAG: extracellular solute-binding protein, partial [Candidatus Caldarchaeum sp.]|nr:extracellular solute-binding protein [Candidatus Caldarchaeum sp.]MDW8435991.1 extracellular solute-binding protein [Candidatus Caldarchaeum sp.]